MTEDTNVGFHFNPRIQAGEVVRNTRLGPKWLEEEKDARYFPFKRMVDFQIVIRCGADKYVLNDATNLSNYTSMQTCLVEGFHNNFVLKNT